MAGKFKAHLVRTMDLVDSFGDSPFGDVEEASIQDSTHTVKNVCVFGSRNSLNGYSYTDQAIDTLTGKTGGAKFFINHPSKSEHKERDGVRDVRDWAGMFESARREGEKVYADLRVRPIFWDLVKDVAVMKPQGIGNSINSRVKVFKNDAGEESVLDIDVLKSIDLVAAAATTQNLWESYPEEVPAEDEWTKDQRITKLEQRVKEMETAMSDPVDDKTKDQDTEDVMDYTAITLETLTKERPDLVDTIRAAIEEKGKVKEMETTIVDLKSKFEDLTKAHEELKADSEKAVKENEELKKKLDEYETKDKRAAKEALVKEKIEAAKLPKEAVSEVFMADLMSKDEEAIEASINDRKELWAKGSGKVKNAGDEFVPEDKTEAAKDPDKAKERFLKSIK